MERIAIAMQDGGAGAGARHEAAARAARPTSFCLAAEPLYGPPVGGTFHFEISLMPPLPKTCPKMVFPPPKRGVAFLTKDVFEKKIFSCGKGFRCRR